MTDKNHTPLTPREVFGLIFKILSPESSFYSLAIIYGIGISLLSLATPISVQMLINTVANTGLTLSLVVLSGTLLVLMLLSAALNAMRIHIMDLFQRRFYARMVSEIVLKAVYAVNPFFEDQGRSALFNRYFDIVIIQKNVPDILIGGFTIVLQTMVGLVLVSFYHPLFLLFNIVLVFIIWLIWIIWGGRAIRSMLDVSHKKHATAAWLESVGESNGYFKSDRHISKALDRTESVTSDYIKAHKLHFSYYLAQTISFLVLYALSSSVLLGLGGWLVIEGELSLGQLVAAELVLSVAFFGISQLGAYMGKFYELCAAVEELSLFDSIEQEKETGSAVRLDSSELSAACAITDGYRDTILEFELPAGARVMAVAESYAVQRDLMNVLHRYKRPARGYMALGGIDITSILPHTLRQELIYLARPMVVEMSIVEFLDLSGTQDSLKRDLEVLDVVGLTETIANLPEGLDTRLSTSGWPLSVNETMRLRLASAIIAQPRVLVLNQLFDVMPDDLLKAALDLLQSKSNTLVIYFTERYRDLGFSDYLYLGNKVQQVTNSFEALQQESNDIVQNLSPAAPEADS